MRNDTQENNKDRCPECGINNIEIEPRVSSDFDYELNTFKVYDAPICQNCGRDVRVAKTLGTGGCK